MPFSRGWLQDGCCGDCQQVWGALVLQDWNCTGIVLRCWLRARVHSNMRTSDGAGAAVWELRWKRGSRSGVI